MTKSVKVFLRNCIVVSPEQIGNLHKRFKSLSNNSDTLSREDLENISDLTFNPIRSQIIDAFFDKRNFRQDQVGTAEEISFGEFLTVMSHFRPLKHNMTQEDKEKMRKEKLRFLFNMHDKDNDGFITLDEYRQLVEDLLSKAAIEGELTKSVADAAMLEVASVTMGQMAPDEVYEGITFEHFLQILRDVEIESKMHVRFWHVDAMPLSCGK
ncbi:Calcineurin B homologous protein 3 [Bagarius yarrelli]|uniref:Calcineurin B homologous protein 3 n=1 Tax=Bagarius yarrelli TaxID=175774 RepID=A0A556V4H8_BAGYA|nr:Calcineurin B homologous protein 3 [Bagarius yarrelli]